MRDPTPIPVPERDWLDVLREACAVSSQRRVAERLGVSPTVVNQVLLGRYKSSSEALEERVRGELMAQTVGCPALGMISTRRCEDEQRRGFSSANPVAIRRYRACRAGCPRYRGQDGQKGGAR